MTLATKNCFGSPSADRAILGDACSWALKASSISRLFPGFSDFTRGSLYQLISHVYQPVMLRELLSRNGRATIKEIARALLNEDRSQIEYYTEITKNMVGRVLTNRNVVKREGDEYLLLGYENLSPDQVQRLKAACEVKLSEYLTRRGDAIWDLAFPLP